MSDERNMLSRWSQRKAAVRRGEAPPEPADEAPPAPQDAQTTPQVAAIEPNQEVSAEGVPADDDMPVLPPIEELDFNSDYTVFLNTKVPEAIRRAALRKLWTSDPVLANLDGLNDYDEDYNLVDTTITAAQTAYRAGRGYLEEIEKKLDQVDRALGNDAAAGESQELFESGEASEPVREAGWVIESDAAGENSADAPQQAAAAAPGPTPEPESKPAHQGEDRSE